MQDHFARYRFVVPPRGNELPVAGGVLRQPDQLLIGASRMLDVGHIARGIDRDLQIDRHIVGEALVGRNRGCDCRIGRAGTKASLCLRNPGKCLTMRPIFEPDTGSTVTVAVAAGRCGCSARTGAVMGARATGAGVGVVIGAAGGGSGERETDTVAVGPLSAREALPVGDAGGGVAITSRLAGFFSACTGAAGGATSRPGAWLERRGLLHFRHIRRHWGWRRAERSRFHRSLRLMHGGRPEHSGRRYLEDDRSECHTYSNRGRQSQPGGQGPSTHPSDGLGCARGRRFQSCNRSGGRDAETCEATGAATVAAGNGLGGSETTGAITGLRSSIGGASTTGAGLTSGSFAASNGNSW